MLSSVKYSLKKLLIFSSYTSIFLSPYILNILLQQQINKNSKSIRLNIFNSLKSNKSKRNFIFLSKSVSENIIKPENNSKESIVPFSSVSQIENISSVVLNIVSNSIASIEKLSQIDLNYP